MKKTYVLDTNVLLHDPNAIFRFQENDIILPLAVIEELDKFKQEAHSEKGRNAREVSRILDKLRESGKLTNGVALPQNHGATLKVEPCTQEHLDLLSKELGSEKKDNHILAIALSYHKKQTVGGRESKQPVRLVTKDTNLRIIADALGVVGEDYKSGKVQIDELFTGHTEMSVDGSIVDELYTHGVDPAALNLEEAPSPNSFFTLSDLSNPSHTGIGKFCEESGKIVKLEHTVSKNSGGLWGLYPRNREQQFAVELLLNDDLNLVTLVGKAGTGKTLLAIAAGLSKACDDGAYHRVLVSRPVYPLGKDLGFLPGDVDEKLGPWMQPIFDNVDFLLHSVGDKQGKSGNRGYKELIDLGMLQIEPLTYIRGRSIPKQYMIVDEAQNLTPHEVKTIITRAGENTKIILTGDPYQIDNPYVDSSSNGLTYVAERFKDQSIAGHITLTKGERSPLAELASNIL